MRQQKAYYEREEKAAKRSDAVPRLETHRNNLAAEQKIMQRIVSTVRDGVFVHCYLACGHMITVAEDDLKELLPRSIECWACEETKKQFPSE
jgi:hypothetical protein